MHCHRSDPTIGPRKSIEKPSVQRAIGVQSRNIATPLTIDVVEDAADEDLAVALEGDRIERASDVVGDFGDTGEPILEAGVQSAVRIESRHRIAVHAIHFVKITRDEHLAIALHCDGINPAGHA